jgi:hypothetical protein
MVKLYDLIRPFVAIMLFTLLQPCKAQVNNDSIPNDTNEFQVDEIHDFHRKKADILNYLLVDNFNNSALAGSLKSYQAQATYGNNLPGSANNFQYGQIMLDMFFGNKQGRHGLAYRLGMGHAGFSNSVKQRFDYSFQCINKQNYSLRIGVGVGFTMQQFLAKNITYGDMIDDRYGFIYATQDTANLFPSAAFKVNRFQWNAGIQLRIYDGYINFYNINDLRVGTPFTGSPQNYFAGFGANTLYNVNFKKMQIIPSVNFIYYGAEMYNVQGGIFLASNTSKGGGGGIYYNTNNVFTISGLFAWDDFLHITAQVQIPFSNIRLTYPVSNFQITVSYKINDFSKYE